MLTLHKLFSTSFQTKKQFFLPHHQQQVQQQVVLQVYNQVQKGEKSTCTQGLSQKVAYPKQKAR
jgi:hypothetical protein